MKYKTIELVIETQLSDDEITKTLNEGTKNLKELGMILHEIRVVGSATSIIKGIDYSNE